MSTVEYTVVINDQRFTLLRDQIMRDAPNYFTTFFEGPFKETSEGVREMKLHRDPYLFKFIHLYLSGYEILPLPKDNNPSYFSEESRLKNLLLDARFYGLDALTEELEAVVPQAECSGNSEKRQDRELERERWEVFTQRGTNPRWKHVMTLESRDAYNFYMERAERNHDYRAFPMDVSKIAYGLESIYTYRHRSDKTATSEDLAFAIGKIKEP